MLSYLIGGHHFHKLSNLPSGTTRLGTAALLPFQTRRKTASRFPLRHKLVGCLNFFRYSSCIRRISTREACPFQLRLVATPITASVPEKLREPASFKPTPNSPQARAIQLQSPYSYLHLFSFSLGKYS